MKGAHWDTELGYLCNKLFSSGNWLNLYCLEGVCSVTCFLDYKALLPLFNQDKRECIPFILRLKFPVQDLPIELIHIDGKKMPADFLSREKSDKHDASADNFVTWK